MLGRFSCVFFRSHSVHLWLVFVDRIFVSYPVSSSSSFFFFCWRSTIVALEPTSLAIPRGLRAICAVLNLRIPFPPPSLWVQNGRYSHPPVASLLIRRSP